MARKAKFVKHITVEDITGGDVELKVFKHENGGMFAINSRFLEQVGRTDEDDNFIIPDPFCDVEDQFDIVTLIVE